jgi:hypothetical protein
MHNSIESIRGKATKAQLLKFAYLCAAQVERIGSTEHSRLAMTTIRGYFEGRAVNPVDLWRMRNRIMSHSEDIAEPEKRCAVRAVAYCIGIYGTERLSYASALKAARCAKGAADIVGIPIDQAAVFEEVFGILK